MSGVRVRSVSSEIVRKLSLTDEVFLEALLPQFAIVRRPSPTTQGFELRVRIDDDTPTIWDRRGRRHLRKQHPDARRAAYQRELDRFLLDDDPGGGSAKAYDFNDKNFLFRYASGGTLPVMRFTGSGDRNEYYCLLYREVTPIGWNLANGCTDTRAELLNPRLTIERELREELIIADVIHDRRYVFPSDDGKPIDHPAHAVARRLLNQEFPHKNLTQLGVVPVPLTWDNGPDSLRIQMGDDPPITRRGFFLNINGADFGIELDRVAHITLPESSVLFGGELERGHLVNGPVGLFNVKRFPATSTPGALQSRPIRPDFFYFRGKRYEGHQLDGILRHDFVEELRRPLLPADLRTFQTCLRRGNPLGLCPATARIILRYSRWLETRSEPRRRVKAKPSRAAVTRTQKPGRVPPSAHAPQPYRFRPLGTDWGTVVLDGRTISLRNREKVKAFLRLLWDREATRRTAAVVVDPTFRKPASFFGAGEQTVRKPGPERTVATVKSPLGELIHRIFTTAIGRVAPENGHGLSRYYLRAFADSDVT